MKEITDPLDPDVIYVQCKNWDEIIAVCKKATSEGRYSVGSLGGTLLFKDKLRAIHAFMDMAAVHASHMEDQVSMIVQVRDPEDDSRAIAVGPNTPRAIFLHNVSEEDFQMATAEDPGKERRN